jgi:AraC family transcriptional regulator
MRVQTRHAHHRCILQIIERIVRSPNELHPLSELTAFAGFSRHHLNRLFCGCTGESLSEFVRRIRLERIAYLLQTSSRHVADLSEEAGYATPEALTRAFREAYGLPPTRYRRLFHSWRLPAPSGVHWSDDPAAAALLRLSERSEFAVAVITRPPLSMAAMRHTGDYADIPRAWERLWELVPARPWERCGARFLTVYHDDGKLPRKQKPHRADIGYTMSPGDAPPPGMRRLLIPGGPYAATGSLSGPKQHRSAWSYMNDRYIPKRGVRPRNIPGIDEYLAWPLPWDRVQVRVLIGLEMDLGDPWE